MADLLKSISGLLTPGVIQRAATLVGEGNFETERALRNRIVPTLLARLAVLGSSDAGATHLHALVDRAAADRSPLRDLGALFGGGTTTQAALPAAREQIRDLFGAKTDAVVNELAATSGVQIASASSLLALSAAVVLSAVAAEARGMDTRALATLVAGERRDAERQLSPGMRTLLRDATVELRAAPAPVAARRVEPPPATVWPARVVAVTLPLALGLAGLFLWAPWRTGPRPPRPEVKHRLARLALPDGAAVDVAEGSFNHELARYLADHGAAAPRSFVFDGLAFQSGRSTLEPESQPTIADLAAILKAFPSAEVRLEGHTDNVGNPDANQRLSLARAETVRAALITAGVEARRLDAAGFGQEHPVTSNATEQGRAQNRRTELVVTHK